MQRLYVILLLIGLGFPGILSAQCDINELVVDPTDCENGQFSVHINFNVVNPAADQFSVTGNGHNYGTFPYNELPIMVGPLAGDGETEWEFVVRDIENEECSAAVVLGTVQCCGFNEVVIDPTECANPEVFSAVLNFNHFGTGGLGFDVFNANGTPIGFFEYEDLPVTVNGIPSVGAGFTHITICDNDNEDCCRVVEFEGLDCDANDCEIFNVDVIAGDCEAGQFFVTLGFNYENVSAGFTVHGNGHNYGAFEYSDLPITIGPLAGDGETIYEFVVTDTEFGDCSDFGVIGPVSCASADCHIYDLIAEATECENGQFFVELSFEFENVSDEGFTVVGNGHNYGFFDYADVPILLGPFEGNGNTNFEFGVIDIVHDGCSDAVELGFVNCFCGFDEIVVDVLECTGNGTYALSLDFVPVGVANDGFDVYAGDDFVGFFLYNHLPVIIEHFPDSDGPVDELTICDNDHPGCCTSVEFEENLNCTVCDITELNVDASDCNDVTNTFSVTVDFSWTGNAEEFHIYKGDDLIGTVAGANLPAVIDGLTDDGGGAHFSVCAVNFPDCCASVEIAVPDCGDCDIFELQVDVSDCNPTTNTFAVTIDFGWTGEAEVFDIYKGDLLIGTVEGADLPVTIDGLTDDGGGALFEVCAHTMPHCCAHREVAVPQCGVGSCDITSLVAEAFPCDTATQTFSLYIDLEWTGDDQEFHVFKNGVPVGAVSAAHLPDTLHGLTDDGGGALITVCSVTHPDCCASVEISVPECGSCEIFEVVADPGECTGDSTFVLAVSYEFTGFQNEFVDVWTGDTYLGFFHVEVQPIIIEHFPWNGHSVMPLRICQNDHPDCCRVIEFEVPDCLYEVECAINELVVDPLGCDSDSTFSAFVNFNAVGFDGPVQIWTGDVYHGVFPQDLPVLVTGIPENGGGIVLTVCQAENMNCCTEVEFQGMVCENVGAIGNLTVSVSACEEGMFMATLDFDFENVSDSFAVKGNGAFYGYFSYDRVPLTLGPFAGDNVTHWEFAVSDYANPALLDNADVGYVDCTTGIFDVFENTSQLEINYGEDGASFISPPGATECSIWAYDGRLVFIDREIVPGQRVWLSKYLRVTGMYFVWLKSGDRQYFGKVWVE